LQFAFKIVLQLRQFKFRDVVRALLLLEIHLVQGLRVGLSVDHHAGGHSHSLLALADDSRLWGDGGRVRLGHRESNWVLHTTGTLLLEDDLDVSRLGDVEEVLGVSAPNVVTELTTGRVAGPFVLESCLHCHWQLDKLDGVGREASEEERSLLLALIELGVALDFGVWHNNVMNIFLIVLRGEPQCTGEFSHFSLGATWRSLENDIVALNFPKTVALGLNSNDQEVDWDNGALADVEIFLHQTDNALGAFCNGQAELGVIEPAITSVEVNRRLLLLLRLGLVDVQVGVGATVSVALPFAGDGELGPGAWENLANIHSVIVGLPVFVAHPPVAVLSERVVKTLFKTLVVVPSLVFVSEGSEPNAVALSPGVSDENKLKI
jgi:hypothetical protein